MRAVRGFPSRCRERPLGRLASHHIVSLLFGIKLRDVDCDFRLMRRTIFDRINLVKTSGIICVEMMKKVQDAGFRIVEVPVHHYHRAYGKSGFFDYRLSASLQDGPRPPRAVVRARRPHGASPHRYDAALRDRCGSGEPRLP